MANKKSDKKTSINQTQMVKDIMKNLLPMAEEIARHILEDMNEPSKKAKSKSKKLVKLSYRQDYCKCGNVKLKTSKVCRECKNKRE